jgi:hypothetical protein
MFYALLLCTLIFVCVFNNQNVSKHFVYSFKQYTFATANIQTVKYII